MPVLSATCNTCSKIFLSNRPEIKIWQVFDLHSKKQMSTSSNRRISAIFYEIVVAIMAMSEFRMGISEVL